MALKAFTFLLKWKLLHVVYSESIGWKYINVSQNYLDYKNYRKVYKPIFRGFLAMVKTAKYSKAITVKFPKEVWDAMEKRIEKKQKFYPRYSDADLIRTSVVKHLKEKGLLKRDRDYL